jgi:CRP/FNR family transcriptional regulator
LAARESDRCTACEASTTCSFTNLTDEAREEFQELAQARFYSAGTMIIRQGERADGLYILQSGLIRLLHLTESGKPVGVRMLTPSEMIGLTEVITGDPYHVTAETVEECRLEFFPRKQFVPFLLRTPSLAVELLVRMSQDFERLQEGMYESDGGLPLVVRLLHKLQELADACGVSTDGGLLLDAPLTVQDLAGTLGCSRQWASKMLSEIEARGLIERRGRRIVLTDAGLQANHPLER